jgi:diaminopimelate epimerase
MIGFRKYHALGNDYLVLDHAGEIGPEQVRRLCDRHRGVGADGLLLPWSGAPCGVRILNSDGSEAWMSGNGLRIWARALVEDGTVPAGQRFTVATRGAAARVLVGAGREVTVELAPPRFASGEVPVAGPAREVLEEPLTVGGERVRISAVSLGNPHCVVRRERALPADAWRLGPLLENHPLFPERTNVQLVEVVGRAILRIEIWERGSGYTLASGSSSCAAVAVAQRLGWCDPVVRVRMAGGEVEVRATSDGGLALSGPVVRVAAGTVDPDFFR